MHRPKVGIIDYRLGNIYSIFQALARLGCDAEIVRERGRLAAMSHLILPGVGAFSIAMRNLQQSGLDLEVVEFAKSGRPLLGICLGMQILCEESEEFGLHKGLGLISGRVEKIASASVEGAPLKVPNIGWRSLNFNDACKSPVTSTLRQLGGEYYFVHSFSVTPANKEQAVAYSEYGGHSICAAVMKDNIFATQFHPENSGNNGLHWLRTWLDAP